MPTDTILKKRRQKCDVPNSQEVVINVTSLAQRNSTAQTPLTLLCAAVSENRGKGGEVGCSHPLLTQTMKCEDPILAYFENGKKTFVKYSKANPVRKLSHNMLFSCGTCLLCRKRRAQELAMRCVLHASLYEDNSFLTLTYDETRKDYHNDFTYADIQKFKKRLRKHLSPTKVQIFNVHEYGHNGKKHWHLVVFNHAFPDRELYTIRNGNSLFVSPSLEKLWPYGYHTIGNVTEASAMYQAQYQQKDFKYGNLFTEKKSHSIHSGIGRDYFLKHYEQILRLGYIPFSGKKYPVPRYFQKLAHKHYSHFHAKENFHDTPTRKKLYTAFKPGQENKEIADLYPYFETQRQLHIQKVSHEWEQKMLDLAFSKDKTDFQLSGENQLYDLKNKINNSHF